MGQQDLLEYHLLILSYTLLEGDNKLCIVMIHYIMGQ